MKSLFQRHRIEFPLPRKESGAASRGRQIKKKNRISAPASKCKRSFTAVEEETYERSELTGLRIHDENVVQFVIV